ncbi:MAG: tRNA1(Val) (adenine(37)-N6)-methyltransferase [Desulfobacteraceae bacterium]|nr:MAG: tRNA1(Val) (adenine(37)-N6)-methyltransferase [Desulfobacteraceae bacterium]
MTELTSDTLPGGGLKITQSPSGYRYSMDAMAIADFANLSPNDRVLDLGAGCGIISLLLAARYPGVTIYGVELLIEQVDLGRQNITGNGMKDRVTLFHQDIRTVSPAHTAGPVDVVISNPPHIKKASGRKNPNPEVAIARHEIHVTLKDIIDAAERMLRPTGRLMMVYPAGRMPELIDCMRKSKIEPKTLTVVYTRPNLPARRILIEGVKGGRPGMTITQPRIVQP